MMTTEEILKAVRDEQVNGFVYQQIRAKLQAHDRLVVTEQRLATLLFGKEYREDSLDTIRRLAAHEFNIAPVEEKDSESPSKFCAKCGRTKKVSKSTLCSPCSNTRKKD